MDIPFNSEFDSTRWAFLMTVEPQQMAATYDDNVSRLSMGATFKRAPQDNNQPQDMYPVILNLYGKLYRMNASHEYGAQLQPVEALPISLISPNASTLTYLSFLVSPHYLQFLEEQRTSQHGQDMMLAIQIWGTVAIMQLRGNTPGVSPHLQSRSGELIRFEKVDTRNFTQPIRIARSDWIDRILLGLGYRHSILIELPLVRTPAVPQAYQRAAETLDMARRAFEQEDYRGAAKHARDVLDYLAKSSQGKQLTSFCDEYIKPFAGETRSRAIDRSLNAVREIANAGSHLDPNKPFTVDRATAAYLIETLALNLRYISAVLA